MTYLTECSADSPTVLFPMDTYSSGYTDSSGNTRDLNVLSGTAPGSGFGPDGALSASWGGSPGYLRTTYSQGRPTTGTYEFWIKIAANPAAIVSLTNWSAPSGSEGATSNVQLLTTGKIRLFLWTGSSNIIDSASALTTGAWHHVIASWGTGGSKIRIDKVTAVTGAATSATNPNAGTFFVHAQNAGGPGIIEQTGAVEMAWAGFYPTKLSDTRTDAHYDAMVPVGGGPINGVLDVRLPFPQIAFTGLYSIGTDTSNKVAGLRLGGYVMNEAPEPPIAELPAIYTPTRSDDMALWLPPPTIENGRIQ